MPVRVDIPTIFCETFHRASQIPSRVWDAMRKDPRSNIILPTADKALQNERQGSLPSSDECWIVCYTTSSRLPDFVLTVTNGPIGRYPVFIWSPRPAKELAESFLQRRMPLLVGELLKNVDVRRVFSVFALDAVTIAFAECWNRHTGVDVIQEPYYHANFSYCDSSSLAAEGRDKADPDTILRLATPADLEQTSALCRGFAAESEPFVLSADGALREAKLYTSNQQLWVYEHAPNREITCIVAVTRKSTGVAAITKVYTHPNWRGRKCAAKLVRRVTDELLNVAHMSRTVLFVAHNNEPASRVYHRVGYKGLFAEEGSTPLVESWLELGFDRGRVDLGHW